MTQEHTFSYSDDIPFTFTNLPLDIQNAIYQSMEVNPCTIENYRPYHDGDYDIEVSRYYLYFIHKDQLSDSDLPISDFPGICGMADNFFYVPIDQVPGGLRCGYGFRTFSFDFDCFVLRPTRAYYDYLTTPLPIPTAPTRHIEPFTIPDYRYRRDTKKQTPYQLNIHYQRQIDGKLINQKSVYYRVIDGEKKHYLGLLNGQGQATIPNIAPGEAKVYYGLTREDASESQKDELHKEHQKLVQQLQQALDAIIAKTKEKATRDNAALKNKGRFGEGWVYTEAFFKGLADRLFIDKEQAFEKNPKQAIINNEPVETAKAIQSVDILANLVMATWRGHGTEYLQNYLAKQQAEDEAFIYLVRLLTDKKCRDLLMAFPARYAHADSSIDESRMLGHFIPTLIILLVTKGRSAMLAKSEELDAIIESLAGDEGTLERLGVQIEDQGMVDSAESEIDTVKDLPSKSSISEQPYKFKPGKLEEHFEKHGNKFKKLSNANQYTKEDYLKDANSVIKNGKYSKKLHGYVRIAGGRRDAKVAIAGLDRDTQQLTTFHIKTLTYLLNKDPNFGWEK